MVTLLRIQAKLKNYGIEQGHANKAYGPHSALPGMACKLLKVLKKQQEQRTLCDRTLCGLQVQRLLSGPLQKNSNYVSCRVCGMYARRLFEHGSLS